MKDHDKDTIISAEVYRAGVIHKFKSNTWYQTSMWSCKMLVLKLDVQGSTLYAHGLDEGGRDLSLPVSWLKIPSPLEQLAKEAK